MFKKRSTLKRTSNITVYTCVTKMSLKPPLNKFLLPDENGPLAYPVAYKLGRKDWEKIVPFSCERQISKEPFYSKNTVFDTLNA